MAAPLHWDIFCRVVDNYGDVGVSWRLAADLASRGESVRLWLDDPSALAWMAPGGVAGIEVLTWREPGLDVETAGLEPADVVIETFGCDPPETFIACMARRATAPVWINLEYLSAEPYVERSHGLPSPVLSGPGRGLTKWFFYPGFNPRTGGLLREPHLLTQRSAFDRDAWLGGLGLQRRSAERVVSLFAYASAPFRELVAQLDRASEPPTLLLLAAGSAQAGFLAQMQAVPSSSRLRVHAMPWLSQTNFDRLLWSSELNFVRGEDSLVRALWAGAPFVWQTYPQRSGVHAKKIGAMLDCMLDGSALQHAPPVVFSGALRALWLAWNGLAPWPSRPPEPQAWRAQSQAWCGHLTAQPDLATQLLGFVAQKR